MGPKFPQTQTFWYLTHEYGKVGVGKSGPRFKVFSSFSSGGGPRFEYD